MENKQIFYYFNLFSEITVAEYGVCDHNLIKDSKTVQ